jgi:multisubunit Na+/H+ antiporter MnhC subunit
MLLIGAKHKPASLAAALRDARGRFRDAGIRRLVQPARWWLLGGMSERRVLIALLLLAAAAALYIWGLPASPENAEKSPQKTDAEERSKADPFPQTPK